MSISCIPGVALVDGESLTLALSSGVGALRGPVLFVHERPGHGRLVELGEAWVGKLALAGLGQLFRGEERVATVRFEQVSDPRLLRTLASVIPSVEPLGSGSVMPAFALGFEAFHENHSVWEQFEAGVPRWVMEVDQQAGGYCMSYPTVTGALLRLSANAEHAHLDPSPLVEALQLMAEDPDEEALRTRYPSLNEVWGTHGAPYGRTQLSCLEAALGRHFSLPPLSDGIEAFVRFQADAALDCLFGWTMVSIDPHVETLEGEGWSGLWTERERFGPDHLAFLRRIGHRLFPEHGEPRLFLVWENSD